MNPIYSRYLKDEKFRNAVLAAAHRERSAAMARFFSNSIRFLFQRPEPRRAPRPRFARQG
jgi:hypothetical protein